MSEAYLAHLYRVNSNQSNVNHIRPALSHIAISHFTTDIRGAYAGISRQISHSRLKSDNRVSK